VLVLIVCLAVRALLGQEQRSPEFSSTQVPVKVMPLVLDPGPEPATMEAAISASDAVVVVKLGPREYGVDAASKIPITRFHAEVVETLWHGARYAVGRSIDIERAGGVVHTAEGDIAYENTNFPPWTSGDTYLVFLRWVPQVSAFNVSTGADGSYRLDLTSDSVKTYGQGRIARDHDARSAAALLAEIRTKARR